MENDLTSRSALEIAVRELADKHHALGQIEFANGVIKTITRIHAAPTIDAVPVVHGRWVMRGGRFRCSECDTKALWRDTGGTGGFSHEFEQAKTCACPSCFARMDGEEARQ